MSATLATTDPAIAAAMGRCLTARVLSPDHPFTERHPRPCGWCEWPTAELRAGLDAYNDWAAPVGRTHRSGRHVPRVFAELRQAEQEALIVEAQAFPEQEPASDPEPVQVVEPSATPVIEEENAWV